MRQHTDVKKIQILANIISSTYKVDVGIVNEDMIAVAGTGAYVRNIGVTRPKESYVVHCIKTGEELLLQNATYARNCYLCEIRNTCPFTMVSFNPIVVGNKVKACLMLLASNEDHHKVLSTRLKRLKRDLAKANVIISDIWQNAITHGDHKEQSNELRSIINIFEEPLLITNRIGKITHVNAPAKHIMRCREGDLLGGEIDELLFSEGCKSILSSKVPDRRYLILPGNQDLIFSAKPILVGRLFEGYVIRLKERSSQIPTKPVLLNEEGSFTEIIGKSPILQRVIDEARRVANTNLTVLLLGETGTGKELFANGIHQESFRSKEPFVVLNCSALPDNLLESEMFGYEEGAFTGARKGGKKGKFEEAHRGTIFLDEIGDLPLALQAKLLRVLENGHIEKIGSTMRTKVDVRIIAATNRNLPKMVDEGTFRQDLYYRLNVVPILLPSLRERKDDIPLLIEHFVSQFSRTTGLTPKRLSPEVEHLFLTYPWPGNVRELKNTLEYLLQITSSKMITISDLPRAMKTLLYQNIRRHEENESTPPTIQRIEQEAIEKSILRFGDTTEGKKKAAKSLGISLATLYRRLSLYGRGKKPWSMKDIRVVIRYCGGCNPRYDRKLLVDEFFERTTNMGVVRVLPGSPAEYVIIVCGCPIACADNDDNRIIAKYNLVIHDENDLERIVGKIADRESR